MRIAVNTRLLMKGKLEGIGWFAHQTLRRMVMSHPEHEFIFFFDRPYAQEFIYAANVTPVVVAPQARHAVLYHVWFDLIIPILLKKYKANVFLSPDGLGSLTTQVPTCIVIHDLAFEHFPKYVKKSDGLYMRNMTGRIAQKAKRVVTVSEFSRKDIAERYQIPIEKIDLTHNGAHEAYHPLSHQEKEKIKMHYSNGQEYFVFTGALHPRKNLINLLKAFIVFKRKFKTNMKLVIVGRMAWKFEEILKMKEEMPFKEDVVWTGYLQVEELSRVTGAAYAMVYASLFEGFGIPILEALACQVPVIVSNTSSMPEVAGEAGLLVDPYQHRDIAEKMGMIYKDENLREQLISKSQKQYEKYNWDSAASRLWESVLKTAAQ